MDIMAEFDQAGAILLDRHFVYSGKEHGPAYINMDRLFPRTALMRDIGADMAEPFVLRGPRKNTQHPFDVVAAPATGGIAIAYSVAQACLWKWDLAVDVVWADKVGDKFVFERSGFVDTIRGKRVLVVEDLLNSGGSVAKVCREVEKIAEVYGVSVACNRGVETAESLGVRELHQLAKVDFVKYMPSACPLCAAGVPIVTDIGHGDEYEQAHPDYAGGYIKLMTSEASQ